MSNHHTKVKKSFNAAHEQKILPFRKKISSQGKLNIFFALVKKRHQNILIPLKKQPEDFRKRL